MIRSRCAWDLSLACAAVVSSCLPLASCAAPAGPPTADDWPVYGGDSGGMKYSALTRIDRSNVAQLEVAWS